VSESQIHILDLIVIGAGPAGLTAAFEASKSGIDYLVLERGLLANTIYQYPIGLTVFSTPDELEIEPGPLTQSGEKPTREQLLSYYVRFVRDNSLNVKTGEEVRRVSRENEIFVIETNLAEYKTRKLIFASGAMDHPRKLGVPGEELPKVHQLFRETYPWVGKKAMVIGGGNSAGEAALFLAQEGVETILAIYRADWENSDPKQGCIKYWVKEPLEMEKDSGCLTVFFLRSVERITENYIEMIDESGQRLRFENDVVFVLIGSDADLRLSESVGVTFTDSKYGRVPIYDPDSFQTVVEGVYTIGHFTEQRHIAGAIKAGRTAIGHITQALGVEKR
jgi:thioredoxin reductase (NADPH)